MSEEKLEIDTFDLFVENCPACESETCEKIMYVDGNYPKVDCEYHFCNLYGEKKKECGEIKDCIIKNNIKQLQTSKEENEKLTQQNKHMREALEIITKKIHWIKKDPCLMKIKNCEKCTDKPCPINIAQQALKGGE